MNTSLASEREDSLGVLTINQRLRAGSSGFGFRGQGFRIWVEGSGGRGTCGWSWTQLLSSAAPSRVRSCSLRSCERPRVTSQDDLISSSRAQITSTDGHDSQLHQHPCNQRHTATFARALAVNDVACPTSNETRNASKATWIWSITGRYLGAFGEHARCRHSSVVFRPRLVSSARRDAPLRTHAPHNFNQSPTT